MVLKVLIITGKLAEKSIHKQIPAIQHDVDVLALPVNVASFITPNYVVKALRGKNLEMYDLIIIPGTVSGDVTPIEEEVGIPTYKGPLHVIDLPLIFSEDLELSKTVPASELLIDIRRSQAIKEIIETEENWREIIEANGGILIGKTNSTVPVGKGFPMRVIAEIVNAPLLSLDLIKKRALYYKSQKADIIDIGMLAGNPCPEKICSIIKAVREVVKIPLSIDTLDPLEIKTAIDCGIDMILSLDAGNIDQVAQYVGDEAIVVLPTNLSIGFLPQIATKRIKAQEQNIETARSYGIEKIIADLVVEPLVKPGLLEPLIAYHLFHERNPKIPLLFGIGNAVELIDADSPGVSAALSALASEAGANLLHVPEHSVKTKGNVNEMVISARMVFLSQSRETAPKDLGLDLLLLKEKRWYEDLYSINDDGDVLAIQGIPENDFYPDQMGWFKIMLDRENNKIVVIYYPNEKDKPEIIIKGSNTRDIYQTIIRNKLITKLDHAAYLGRELKKAEIALRIGRSYKQDEPLFT
jgi:dihydropteroate synthase-like protein